MDNQDRFRGSLATLPSQSIVSLLFPDQEAHEISREFAVCVYDGCRSPLSEVHIDRALDILFEAEFFPRSSATRLAEFLLCNEHQSQMDSVFESWAKTLVTQLAAPLQNLAAPTPIASPSLPATLATENVAGGRTGSSSRTPSSLRKRQPRVRLTLVDSATATPSTPSTTATPRFLRDSNSHSISAPPEETPSRSSQNWQSTGPTPPKRAISDKTFDKPGKKKARLSSTSTPQNEVASSSRSTSLLDSAADENDIGLHDNLGDPTESSRSSPSVAGLAPLSSNGSNLPDSGDETDPEASGDEQGEESVISSPKKLMDHLSTHRELCEVLRTPLKIGDQGPLKITHRVYVFTDLENPGTVKVGISDNVNGRVKQIRRECKVSAKTYWKSSELNKEEAKKAEKLVHADLHLFNEEIRCGNCKTGKVVRHREWFKVPACTAKEAAERWVTFMELRPYNPMNYGNLHDVWESRRRRHNTKIDSTYHKTKKGDEDIEEHLEKYKWWHKQLQFVKPIKWWDKGIIGWIRSNPWEFWCWFEAVLLIWKYPHSLAWINILLISLYARFT